MLELAVSLDSGMPRGAGFLEVGPFGRVFTCSSNEGRRRMARAGNPFDLRMIRRRKRLALAATFIALVVGTRVAQASNTWDPTGDRMAWTDRSTAMDIQPRIWLLTNGSLGNPGRLLMTRRPDVSTNGWLNLQIGGLDTGLDAVYWQDGATQRQRVFFVKNGEIFMLTYD